MGGKKDKGEGDEKSKGESSEASIISSGDAVYIKGFAGNYFDVEEELVQARYPDRGAWQKFTIEKGEASSSQAADQKMSGIQSGPISNGDTVYLLAHTSKYVDVEEGGTSVRARWQDRGGGQKFVVEKASDSSPEIRNGDEIFLKANTGNHIDIEGGEVQARWDDHGEFQKLVIEKDDDDKGQSEDGKKEAGDVDEKSKG